MLRICPEIPLFPENNGELTARNDTESNVRVQLRIFPEIPLFLEIGDLRDILDKSNTPSGYGGQHRRRSLRLTGSVGAMANRSLPRRNLAIGEFVSASPRSPEARRNFEQFKTNLQESNNDLCTLETGKQTVTNQKPAHLRTKFNHSLRVISARQRRICPGDRQVSARQRTIHHAADTPIYLDLLNKTAVVPYFEDSASTSSVSKIGGDAGLRLSTGKKGILRKILSDTPTFRSALFLALRSPLFFGKRGISGHPERHLDVWLHRFVL
ncbi:superoxide dismutase [Striga asiatica]|uniref:Superoxide dismutase n=1 Tax=Striga asiatica TaxID=4170 RepID=A0A5A7NYS6_STRAF|nr:superoxide dismutase [Striga asiatica]